MYEEEKQRFPHWGFGVGKSWKHSVEQIMVSKVRLCCSMARVGRLQEALGELLLRSAQRAETHTANELQGSSSALDCKLFSKHGW